MIHSGASGRLLLYGPLEEKATNIQLAGQWYVRGFESDHRRNEKKEVAKDM